MNVLRRFVLPAVAILLGWNVFQSSAADATPEKSEGKPRILFVTQSFEFVHDVVNRKGAPLAVAEQTMTDLANSSGVFQIDCTQDAVKALTKENLQNYDILMFYTTGHRRR